jgi:hypothetical protein
MGPLGVSLIPASAGVESTQCKSLNAVERSGEIPLHPRTESMLSTVLCDLHRCASYLGFSCDVCVRNRDCYGVRTSSCNRMRHSCIIPSELANSDGVCMDTAMHPAYFVNCITWDAVSFFFKNSGCVSFEVHRARSRLVGLVVAHCWCWLVCVSYGGRPKIHSALPFHCSRLGWSFIASVSGRSRLVGLHCLHLSLPGLNSTNSGP